jgi:DNA polymerase delta subunit 3
MIETELMHDLSDEEADAEDAAMLDEGAITETGDGKSKKEREEELRRMMDMEGQEIIALRKTSSDYQALTTHLPDEPMPDEPSKPAAAETPRDAGEEAASSSQPKEESSETVIVSDGRRRGRRRIMKKKTVQDEEGYLGMSAPLILQICLLITPFVVTREEPAWESFSEEEPAPKKPKVSVAPPAAKPKKAAPKGQGNIMSFFSKK